MFQTRLTVGRQETFHDSLHILILLLLLQFLISEATVYSLANQLWKYSKFCRLIVTQVVNEHVFSL
jgi:hypothetical protein